MNWRYYAVVFGFCAMVVLLGARVVILAVNEREFLQAEGDARSVRDMTLRARRGVVRDRLGEPLAVSTPVYSVWSDPSLTRPSAEEVRQLAALLGMQTAQLEAKFADRERQFVYLKRRLDWPLAQQVRALGATGVYLATEYRRYYPAGETAAHVVGISRLDEQGSDERGVEGIETAFDERLRSRTGKKQVLRDRTGSNIRDLGTIQEPKFGEDLTLTLDLRLQFIAYRELKAAVETHAAKSGSLVMLDARSGEILALANQPSYNPNAPLQEAFDGVRNRAVTDAYEPGSTIKPFTVLAALESGDFSAQSTLDTSPGFLWVGEKLVQDPLNRGVMTLASALQKSSQVAIAKLALAMEEREVYDVLARAGLGAPVGSGLPGETSGVFSDSGLNSDIVRTTLAYGYGLSLSPLQLAQAYLSLANGGLRQHPRVVVSPLAPPEAEQIYDRDMTQSVLRMMETVTDEAGTAPKARVAGYRVAGKTGTSRVVGRSGYDDERHVALFAGAVPVTDPRLVMVVVINQPTQGVTGGGAVAAPVFSRVAERSLRLLGVPGDAPATVAVADRGGRV